MLESNLNDDSGTGTAQSATIPFSVNS